LTGSFGQMCWCICFMLIVLLIFSLLFVQGVAEHMKGNPDMDPELMEEFRMKFGSVEGSMFSLFQAVTGGDDWMNFYSLIEQTGVLYTLLFLAFITWFTISVWNIVTSLFVEKALSLVVPDIDKQVLERKVELQENCVALKNILTELDTDGSGLISMSEISQVMTHGSVSSYLEVMGLDVKDAEMFFHMLATISDSTDVPIDLFVAGCMRLKGAATALDLQTMAFENQVMYLVQKRFNSHLLQKVNEIGMHMGHQQQQQQRFPAQRRVPSAGYEQQKVFSAAGAPMVQQNVNSAPLASLNGGNTTPNPGALAMAGFSTGGWFTI